jgi:hypothetical protein
VDQVRIVRLVALSLVVAAVLTVVAPGWAHDRIKRKRFGGGDVFCTSRALVAGSLVIDRGRCFRLAVLRERRGAFLALLDPAVVLPVNRHVWLGSPAGLAVRDRIVFLVPIRPAAQVVTLVPINAVQVVPVVVEDAGPRVTIVLGGAPVVHGVVAFRVRDRDRNRDDDDD